MLGIELLREWDGHKGNHRCYYEESDDAGTARCPRSYPNLRSFLDAAGFSVENLTGQFFGRDLNEPNFRSENPVSIAEMRRLGALRVNRGVHYRDTTTEVLSSRARKAVKAPSENDERPWEVEAMEYFKGRLDEIHESMVRAFSGVMAEQGRLHTRIDALVELVSKEIDERSESRVAVEPKVVVTLENVPADVAEELQAELQTRVQRILARRAQHSDSC